MMRVDRSLCVCCLIALLVGGLACASDPDPRLQRARSEYSAAESDPAVAAGASVELYEAKQAVDRLENALEDDDVDDDSPWIDHLAYLADQKIQIARTAATEATLRKEIEELGERRDDLRLRARTTEAQMATVRAEAAEGEAEAAKRELAESRMKAERIEQRFESVTTEETSRGLVLTMSDVLFATASSELQPGARDALDEVAEFLQEYPDRGIAVEGHTDNVGTNSYNQQLSDARARAVARELEHDGVPGSRIDVRGFGEDKPIAPNDNEAGRQQNRRVEIVIENPRVGRAPAADAS